MKDLELVTRASTFPGWLLWVRERLLTDREFYPLIMKDEELTRRTVEALADLGEACEVLTERLENGAC